MGRCIDVHPGVEMVQKWVEELKAKTGRFAQIKPTTNTRIDLGFALTRYREKLPKKLIDTGGLAKKERITHGIPVTSVKEIDGEVK